VCGELLSSPESAIRHTQVDREQPAPTRSLAAKNVQLMTQREVL
jgi:hypothetical protein